MYVIIVGAGTLGSQVIKKLVKNNHNVVVIDIDREVCETIYAETGAMTIHGNATKLKTLEKAGAGKCDVFITLMRKDADNIATSLLAKSFGVKKIIARVLNPEYENAYELSGVTNIVNMSELILEKIITEVEDPLIRKIFSISKSKVGVYAIRISQDAKVVGKTIKDIAQNKNFPKQCVFMGIYPWDGDFIIPRGNYEIKKNDTVFLVSRNTDLEFAVNILTKKRLSFLKKLKK